MMRKISHQYSCMLSFSAAAGRTGVRTRLLGSGLLAYVLTMAFFGPSVAERALEALGCPGRWGSAETSCQGLALLPANALAPWLSVAAPVDTAFFLLQQSWPFIATWLALIALSMVFDWRQGTPGAAQPEAFQASEITAPALAASASFETRQAEWVRQKQVEQAHEQSAAQLSLHRQLLAQGKLWGSLSILFIALLGGGAFFCLALGTPLIGGLSAESVLQAFGCSDQSLMASNPWSGPCGFWTDRLAPYQTPWFGALLSPVWLFTQFSDVLLIWIASLLLLALLFVYRVGWSMVFKNTPRAFIAVGLIVFSAALLITLHQIFIAVSPPLQPIGDSGLGATVKAFEMVFVVATALVFALAAGLVALIVLVIALVRQFIKMREHNRLNASTQVKPMPPP